MWLFQLNNFSMFFVSKFFHYLIISSQNRPTKYFQKAEKDKEFLFIPCFDQLWNYYSDEFP